MRTLASSVLLSAVLVATACATPTPPEGPAEEANPYRFAGDTNFLTDHPPLNGDGTVNVVVEIPAGTTAKWEVTKPDGALEWEFRDGSPRVVRYLGYPGNYGMIPGTLLPRDAGGDGDPLDVIVLGEALPRGSVIPARIVGVLRLLDGGEHDDKLLAVRSGTPFEDVTNLDDLAAFEGVTRILETWFTHYKGPDEMESLGFGDVNEARRILDGAVAAAHDAAPRPEPRKAA